MPAQFTLNVSTLGSGAFRTVPVDMDTGSFRSVQFQFIQSGLSQDMEVHFFELHFTITGVSKEIL